MLSEKTAAKKVAAVEMATAPLDRDAVQMLLTNLETCGASCSGEKNAFGNECCSNGVLDNCRLQQKCGNCN